MADNILLIENDPAEARVVQDALARSGEDHFHVEWVRLCSEGLERLAEGTRSVPGIAAVLLDLCLPDSRGIETFERLFRAAPQVPFLILSATPDEEVAKLAVQQGAQDYLLKSRLDAYTLPKAVGSMLERAANAEALFEEKERAQVTLDSIGDAVMSSDVRGNVTYLNVVAEHMTGWTREDATGHALDEVFHIVDATTRRRLSNPMCVAIRENKIVALTPNCLLIRRDGSESSIEDSAAPIHDRRGNVTGAVMVFHDVSATRAMSLRMSYLAQHDVLTDLPNRLLLNDRLSRAMTLARRHKTKLAMMFLDVDRFKYVNDSHGHAAGDRLLQSIAKRLLGCVRSSDTVSRQGGDEFVILLSEVTHAEDAAVIAEKVLVALRKPHRVNDLELHVTASIGLVTYPDDGSDTETLLKNADFAMYQAKDSGRDNYQFFGSELNVRARDRQSLEGDLHRALARGEFALHYQPKLNLQTGAIVGVEALIRWYHPTRGLVSPVQFIPIAEECGFIVPLGRWVLREGCREAQGWQDAGLPATSIAINISVVELRAPGFVAAVRDILVETRLDPSCLELELTETFLMQDPEATAVVLKSLKALGVRLALDDFGTGYSSLSYLKRFPIDALKIDRSFVHDLSTDADSASIVSAVISMGKSLKLRVVAEGVESPEQLAFLRNQICPEGQGYLFSYPLDAEAFTRMLSDSVAPPAIAERSA